MATTVDELQVIISANADKFSKEIDSVKKQTSALSSNFSSMSRGISAATVALGNIIADVFAQVGQAIASELDGAITRLDTLNNYSKVMSNLGISSEDAEKSISVLNEGILGLPTSLSDAALATQRLVSVNGNLAASTDMFLAMNNAILAGGASTETQATAMEQLIQAYSKGKPDAVEWRALLTAMPAQMKQIATAMGYTSTAIGGDFQTAMTNGTITMDDFMRTVMKLNEEGVNGFENFDTQARNSTGGVQTSIQNLKIAVQRGMANIMDVIGQSNIAGFINGIASAIGTAANYVAAFVKIVKQAVAWVQALFGVKSGSTNSIVKETSSASSNLGSAASNASDTASNLDDAASSAKKLNKQLASFDEMNTLKESTSSGSGSSDSGSSGAGDWSDYTWDTSSLDDATSKVDEAVEKIKAALRSIFGDIDFGPLGQSIVKLWSGIQNAINGALKIGEKFLSNFIAPLTKYTLENTLPRIFTAVGDALNGIDFDKIAEAFGHVFSALEGVGELLGDVFASLTELLMPIFEWLANFVVPPALEMIATIINTISAVIGGIWDALKEMFENWIAPALESLGSALEPILNLLNDLFGGINENSEAFDTLREIIKNVSEFLLGPLFTALGTIINIIATLINWIVDLVSGVSEAVGNIGDWVSTLTTNIGAWFQAAWDLITSIFSGIGSWFANRWNEVSNAFSNVGNFFGGVFNTARTNVQNAFSNIGSWFSQRWNDVRGAMSSVGSWFGNTFSGAWNGVTNAFGSIGSWFNDRWNDIKNVFGNVWNVFSDIGRNMWEGIKSGLGNVGQKVGDIFSGAIDWVKNIFGIHSPSTLFKKFGGYIDEGFVMGIEQGLGEVDTAMSKLTENFEVPEVGINVGSDLNTSEIEDLNLTSEQDPVHVTVNVGSEKLIDQIVNGINDLSMLQNNCVLNV